jgi:TatD DNase family protein
MKSKGFIMELIDTHAHLFLMKDSPDVIWQNAQKAQIKKIINVAVNIKSSKQVLALHKKNPHLLPTVGIHPSEHQDLDRLSEIEKLLQNNYFCALGEIGLDYYKSYAPKNIQITLFEKQLQLAKKHNLPVIIHNRHADEDTLSIIKNFPTLSYVFHCFSSDTEFVKKSLSPKTFFSFTGTITYNQKGKVIQAIQNLPLENIMLETDSPYLTPQPYRGQSNQPAYLTAIAKKVAEVKKLTLEEVSKQTTRNAEKFFKKN